MSEGRERSERRTRILRHTVIWAGSAAAVLTAAVIGTSTAQAVHPARQSVDLRQSSQPPGIRHDQSRTVTHKRHHHLAAPGSGGQAQGHSSGS